MWTEYRTKERDVLDAICAEYYGSELMTPLVLVANPNLCAVGTHYPAGLIIRLPDVDSMPETTATVNLWD